MQEKEIRDRILKMEKINWQELEFIQQEDFKELPKTERQRLKASFVENNFADPFKIWEDQDGKRYCLDGKHRTLLLKELIEEGVDVPLLLPALFMECEDKKDAARLVLVYSSSYASITYDGMNAFVQNYDLELSELKEFINLPKLSFDKLEQKFDYHNLSDTTKEEEEEDPTEKMEALSDLELWVQAGDIYELGGKHRLYCGSFKDEKEVAILMDGKQARVVFTDPPYNLPTNFFSGKGKVTHTDFAEGAGEMSDDEFALFIQQIYETAVKHSVDGAIIYLCMDFRHAWHVCQGAYPVFKTREPKQLLVWNKSQAGNGSFYRAKHELIFIYKKGKAKHTSKLGLADRFRANVVEYPIASSFSNPDREVLENHPTPKPVQMVSDVCLDVSDEKEIIIDWFMGSGTTIMGAEATGRIAYGTEIEPKYVQLILNRYHKKYPDQEIKCLNRENVEMKWTL
ncbi:DNA-methyltransferase [Bernardetia sp.]|uniref:DNA-methyltransferase n=1 Tax=Bernardetia sp. TaxID=1937974 RepID=UPI0025C27236|nr:site-specific DNA-methyltransferase [Bernardetia sp.]